ncbi:Uncharacterised protein [Mycobacterium tuberculosis]|uniref:Uncharacterized protein n=1 Tax=Mycobacterium tuberculosis TaxID=1773 RepID=A0A655JL74_MYCTX|nr:Uncharacterised protein [Mycobacterium tuberculosis]CNV14743.1 Uncharacterised protein [Mycobacterium tuberculosis]COV61084.1 Uncharacterised protein [Mycobacterium tuberculosis]COV71653.1 Uncharacterised protein [Mycobacterium tuberculosis]COX09570.1 Uncharacterised protein [Mycobacterium tuberculosis]
MPVVVDVVVEAQRPAEPGTFEFASVEIEIGLGEPGRHGLRVDERVLEPRAFGHTQRSGTDHVDRVHGLQVDARVDGRLGRRHHPLTGNGVGQPEQPAPQVFLDLGDDAVLHGEIVLIPDPSGPGQLQVVVAGTALAERAARQADHAATGKRNADSHHAGASVGVQPGEGPGDRRTPVVAHHESLLRTIGVEDAHDVANQFLDAVGLLHPVFRRAAIPALVDGHHAVARAGKRGNLMPPRVPGLRKPVQQHHQRSLLVGWAVRHGMDAGAPAVQDSMDLRHVGLS